MGTPPTLEQLSQYCHAGHVPHTLLMDENRLVGALFTAQATYRFTMLLDCEREVLSVRAGFLMQVPPNRRAEIAQAGMHANQRLLLGAFYLDLTDGELGFDLVVPYTSTGLSEPQVLQCLGLMGGALHHYTPIFKRLADTDARVSDVFDIEPQAERVRQELETFLASLGDSTNATFPNSSDPSL